MARKYRVISALLGSIHATDDTRKNKNETWQMNSRNNLHTRSMSFVQGGSIYICRYQTMSINRNLFFLFDLHTLLDLID